MMAQETNSTRLRSSRYVNGGTAEVNDFAIEWWERVTFNTNPDDRQYVVEAKFAGRLDLIAATFLGEPRLWWIIAMHNNILDPYNEVQEGVILYIPTTERAQSILIGTYGGAPSQRTVPTTILPVV